MQEQNHQTTEEPEEENGTFSPVDYLYSTLRGSGPFSIVMEEPFESLVWALKIYYGIIIYIIICSFQQFLLYMIAGVYKNCYHSWFWRFSTLILAWVTVALAIILLDHALDTQKSAP